MRSKYLIAEFPVSVRMLQPKDLWFNFQNYFLVV